MADSPDAQDALASFMNITGAESDSAVQFLEVGINLFMESGRPSHRAAFAGSPRSAARSTNASSQPVPAASMDIDAATAAAIASAYGEEEDLVRAPDPSKRQRLVESEMDLCTFVGAGVAARPLRHLRDQSRDFAAESIAAMTAGSISTAFGQLNAVDTPSHAYGADGASIERTRDLSTLFHPPTSIIYQGTYADVRCVFGTFTARTHAKNEGKWLLVNIQDEIVFASHMLNRDTWSDDVVQNLVASGFVFWQNYSGSEHGKKFCSLYQIDHNSLPVVIIIDPRTGEIRQHWTGFHEPQDMTEKLSDFCCMRAVDTPMTEQKKEVEPDILDMTEADQLAAAIAASMQGNDVDETSKQDEDAMKQEEKAQPFVTLAPEPDASAPDVTRVQIRVPDGSRLTRRFHKTDSIAMVWTFVMEQVPEARARTFELRTAFPPSAVAYSDTLSIEEGKLENASLMVKWL
ncbi:hypothetical protein CCR75_002773 [Bremia lactucae]|uniref:UBX domain-containing protein n=1 Tax=Bremia lactucae TaxID=4779 RepID=A0A976IF14_BRELC|nr:hypothetical protein CCR75_001842 [Bremia lactucae]TDH69928.1 hypothetical protein CCR75_002773 [Bremia lactucae]